MAEVDELFNIIGDKTTNAGLPLKGKEEGDAVADHQLPVFPCKDSSGNEAKIPLAVDGGVAISLDPPGTPVDANGTQTGIVDTDVTVAAITLTTTETYNCISWTGCATRTTLWKLIQHDDGANTTLQEAITGPGAFTFDHMLQKKEIIAGASGTQELRIVGHQLQSSPTDLHGTVEANEKP